MQSAYSTFSPSSGHVFFCPEGDGQFTFSSSYRIFKLYKLYKLLGCWSYWRCWSWKLDEVGGYPWYPRWSLQCPICQAHPGTRMPQGPRASGPRSGAVPLRVCDSFAPLTAPSLMMCQQLQAWSGPRAFDEFRLFSTVHLSSFQPSEKHQVDSSLLFGYQYYSYYY